MVKILLHFLLFSFSISVFGQTMLDDSITTQEVNFFYKDSIDNEVTIGNYNPTGLVSFDDGSIIVSTEFSISFPGQYDMPDMNNFEQYYEQQKKFRSKSHVSSGSIFKLNSNFEKVWEIFFKDKRVMKIRKLPDQSFVVAGERVDMKKFWMAHVDTSGKIIWQREYKLKSASRIANMIVDTLGNSYLLAGTERVIPISITKLYGKRQIKFFKQTEMEKDMYLVKVSSKGNVLWSTSLDKRKGFEKFGYQLFIDRNIYATSSYEGFVKRKNDQVKKEGNMFFEINSRGKVLKTSEMNDGFVYSHNSNHFSVIAKGDTLIFYTIAGSESKATNTITFTNPVKPIWIYGSLTVNNFTYLLGSKDFNLGCIVVQLDKENYYIGYWNDNRSESTELVDAIVEANGTIVVISKGFKHIAGESNELRTYINLTSIKNNKLYYNTKTGSQSILMQ